MLRLLIALLFLTGTLCALQKEPKICLSMVVKNNADTIGRSLSSVKDLIDCYSICDAGSTDKTLFIVEEIMHEAKIPGFIYRESGRGYDKNEILSIHAAQKILRELGYPLESSYLLLLNPDQHLTISSPFQKSRLKEDGYLLLQNRSLLSYYKYMPNLIRASTPLESVMASEGLPYKKLQAFVIEEQHVNEKGSLEGNLENLELDLIDLAQTYKALKKHEDALRIYQTISERARSREEVWFAKYMTGACFEEMNQWEQALKAYLDAYQYDSGRAEPLYRAALYYRLHGENDLAYLFAKQGGRIPVSHDALLFPAPLLRGYQFKEEISITAYYTPFKEEGYLANNDLLLCRHVPDYIKYQAYQNTLFYIEHLKNSHFEPIVPSLPLIREGFDEHYHPMNPSICKTKNGYLLICRSVNYTQIGANVFNTIDLEGIFRTRNFLIEYDRDFRPLAQKEIVENLPRERFPAYLVEGLEDCRIFPFQNGLWFTCTSCDTNPTGNRQISLCKLPDLHGQKMLEVEKLTPLLGPDPYLCEKNWLPFVQEDALYTVYSYDPFIIYKPDLETGICDLALTYKPVHDFSHFRGSAGPIEFDDGHLVLVHEVVIQNHHRCYMHRFLKLDADFKIQKVSKPFIFRHLGVEYCCSMTLDHSGERLILPIGVEDREAYLCSVDLQTVRSLLLPLPTIRENFLPD